MHKRARDWLHAGSHFDWAPSEGLRNNASLNIFHAEFGDPEAPLLLLIHGFPTSSIDWSDVVGELSATHRVGVLDLPGFGFSAKPVNETYSVRRDGELVGHYLTEILGAHSGAVIAHDRGDSVALTFAGRCAAGADDFTLTHLVLSNGNMFLPLSSLTDFQRLLLDPETAPQLRGTSPQMLAAGLGQSVFSPPRSPEDPTIAALADTFAVNDGIAVLHDTIQYLVERSEHERQWLEALAAMSVDTTLIWGIRDTVAPLRVAAYIWDNYLATKPGDNEFWLLPHANHYPQNDQPREFARILATRLAGGSPDAPGPLTVDPAAPVFVDRSRAALPSARDVLAPLTDPAR